MTTATREKQQRIPTALLGLALVAPCTIFWLAVLLGEALNLDALSQAFIGVVDLYGPWFVLIVLLLMPFAGAVCGALGLKHRPLAGIAALLLGLAEVALNLMMQTA